MTGATSSAAARTLASTLRSGWWWATAVLVLAITAVHYGTDTSTVLPHTVYRRLYYIPIVIAATAGGLRPGLITASLIAGLYFPHAFMLHHHLDPAPTGDKVMEMVLYVGVAALAGTLVERERAARLREQLTAAERSAAEGVAQRLSGLVHLSRGLAHEIRNPLGGLQGAIEILAEDVPTTSPRREMVDVALRETDRLNRVVSDFLDFARPRAPEAEDFDVGRHLEHVRAVMTPDAEKAGVLLTVRAAARPDGSPLRAWADPQQVTQVLVNLVRNAIQATSRGGRVRMEATSTEGSLRVAMTVADTGAGIPEALGASIYDPYVSGRDGGTGLGLPLSLLLVRHNGGTLTHQTSDHGTTFRLDLPTHPPRGETR